MSVVDKHFKGLRVLVTRPKGRGERLSNFIESRGGDVVCFPVIDIVSPADYTAMDRVLANLCQYDLLIFVSVPGVQSLGSRLREKKLSLGVVPVAVVGSKTAEICKKFDIKVTYCPEPNVESSNSVSNLDAVSSAMNSEGLLNELHSFDKAGKRIAIFRGQDGRECIGSALEREGALVDYVESYRRLLTTQVFEPVISSWKANPFDVVLVTSVSILQGLMVLLGDRDVHLLKQTTILTISERIAEVCRENGLDNLLVVQGPTDDQLIRGLDLLQAQRNIS